MDHPNTNEPRTVVDNPPTTTTNHESLTEQAKETLGSAREAIHDQSTELYESLVHAKDALVDKASEFYHKFAGDDTIDKSHASDMATQTKENLKDNAVSAKDKISDKATQAKENIKDAVGLDRSSSLSDRATQTKENFKDNIHRRPSKEDIIAGKVNEWENKNKSSDNSAWADNARVATAAWADHSNETLSERPWDIRESAHLPASTPLARQFALAENFGVGLSTPPIASKFTHADDVHIADQKQLAKEKEQSGSYHRSSSETQT